MRVAEPFQLDPSDVLDVVRARATQTYSELLLEVGQLTAYARALEKQLADRRHDTDDKEGTA